MLSISEAIMGGHLLRLDWLEHISDDYLLGIAQGHLNHPEIFAGSDVEKAVMAELRRRKLVAEGVVH